MLHLLGHVGGVFGAIHQARVGVGIDFGALDRTRIAPPLLARAQAVWAHRVQTEFRSIQVMTRFLGEVLASGDPLEIYAGAAGAIEDEIRHTALCTALVEALGARPALPEPLCEDENAEFLALPMPARALGTAVSMLAISETLSVALISDLHERCSHPVVRAVLQATLEDEDEHRDFGWEYVRASLQRFDEEGLAFARATVQTTLAPHREEVARVLGPLPERQRRLEVWPEPELAELGLLGEEREALLIERTLAQVLAPRLSALGLG